MPDQARLAIAVSHPIQYFAPYYRALAKDGRLHVRVFFASRIGLDRILDPYMGVKLAWNTDLLGGYEHEFLTRAEGIKATGFREINNPGVGRALARFGPDVVLLHGYAQMTMLKALLWCRRNAVPAMMISDSSRVEALGRARRSLKSALLPLIYRQFSAFLSISDRNARYLEAAGVPSTSIFRVPVMVDEVFWRNRAQRDVTRTAMRARLGLGDDDLAVLFVGKLIAGKRPGDLLAALRLLATQRRPARRVQVLFAGDGKLRAALEREAARDRLPARFLGFINIDAVSGYYCAADALAFPSEIDAYGMAVLEAAILGLPLVLGDKVGAIGPTSIARPGENALIHKCGDISELARLLAKLADEPETCARLADASGWISKLHHGFLSISGTLAAIERCLRGRGAGTRQERPPTPLNRQRRRTSSPPQLTTARSVTRRQSVPSENASTAPPVSSDT